MYEKIWNQNKIAFGGDYNPEQWDEATWEEDMHLFGLAHIDTVTLNVFSWAMLQPDESTYDFTKLDRIMELVKKNGLKVVLATSTGAHPAWMAHRYPEILRTEFNGMKRIPVRTVPYTACIRQDWRRSWRNITKTMTILWHGISPMNTAESVTAKTVRRHFTCG